MTSTLADLVKAKVLTPGTVRLARHLGFLYSEEDELVVMATACTITSLSAGSVCFDIRHPSRLMVDLESEMSITWPDSDDWETRLRNSPLVSTDLSARDRGLILDSGLLYLTRYWAEQQQVVEWASTRILPKTKDLNPWLDIYFSGKYAVQKQAAQIVTESSFCVLAGGPGTGKTTVVARILAALSQNRQEPLRVILTAPTGRAAARLGEAVREELASCQAIPEMEISVHYESNTLHKVLGIKPWGAVDYNSTHPLPADLVVVDEASMLSLHLMTLLLDALSDETKLLLVGDPDQLTSVEAGAVLADIVASGSSIPVARLTVNHRFCEQIASLADAIRLGQSTRAIQILEEADPQGPITWIPRDLDSGSSKTLEVVRSEIVNDQLRLMEAAQSSKIEQALAALDSHRLLLAHRHGLTGVAHWTQVVQQWLRAHHSQIGSSRWYEGMPVLITKNEDHLSVYNGDYGVIVPTDDGLQLAIRDSNGYSLRSPDMIQSCEPLYCSTIHKAQGSQFDRVTVMLPHTSAAILTRELLYTAVTRAKTQLRIIGSSETIEQAVCSPALRASGLTSKLAEGVPRTNA
ncbi:MAG: exodeoxyribonuclease V subunit alpha [Propionibacteriaceae bacterium]|jgi:exodeoxyribonuclease V alpha subunit|nr:exodeoxyribonuclease V subunit alpha [Propionibacteriaceae bacterium]